jgi:hypothetical protein
LIKTEGVIVANPPNDLIYDFKGYFESNELASISKKMAGVTNYSELSPDKQVDLLPEGSGSNA